MANTRPTQQEWEQRMRALAAQRGLTVKKGRHRVTICDSAGNVVQEFMQNTLMERAFQWFLINKNDPGSLTGMRLYPHD